MSGNQSDTTQPALRLVVLISGNGSNLQAIIDEISRGTLTANIIKVISNKADAYGLQRAAEAGIETEVLSHKDFPDRESYDKALIQRIDIARPDLLILAGFMRILSDHFVKYYAGKIMNIHPSLLPKYKGLDTHKRVLEANEKEHGCTVHFVTPTLDDGPIILQARIDIDENDTPETLAQRVHEQEHRIYPEAIRLFAEGKIK